MRSQVVRYEAGDRYRIEIGHHALVVDQPAPDDGADEGPTPTELFVASLASCAAFYAGRFLRRHDIDPEGMEVAASFETADRPARVGSIELTLSLPCALPGQLENRLRAVVEHCTVRNSLLTPPELSLLIDAPDPI